MPRKYELTIYGYIRNVEKLGLYTTTPTAITLLILIYTYYFKPIIEMLISLQNSKCDDLDFNITKNVAKLLDDQNNWDLQIIKVVAETKALNIYLNKCNDSENELVAQRILWIIATIEQQTDYYYNNSNASVLMVSKPQQKIFQIMEKWRYSYPVLSAGMSIFANITGCDNIAMKDELITDGFLDVLCQEVRRLDYVVTKKNYEFCYYNYFMLEMISLTMINLTRDRQPQVNNYSKFSTIAAKSLTIAYKLNNHYIWIHDEFPNYEHLNDLLNMIKCALKNTIYSCIQLIKNNYGMMDALMLSLIITDDVLAKCIQFLSYSESKLVRLYLQQVFLCITCDAPIVHYGTLIDNGFFEKIIQIFDSDECKLKYKLSNNERCNFLLILSNVLASNFEQYVMTIVGNARLLQIIFNHLQNGDKSIKNHSLSCLNNALAANSDQVSMLLLTYKNGLLIRALCSILDDITHLQDGVDILHEMECLNKIAIYIFMKKNQKFKQEMFKICKDVNIIGIFKKLQFLKKNEQKSTFDEEYLTKLGLKRFSVDIKYFIHGLD